MATIAKLGPEGVKNKREKASEFWKSRKLQIRSSRGQIEAAVGKCPSGEKKLFKAAADYVFLRFNRAIAALATSLLSLILIEFFDDFTQVEPAASAASAQEAIEGLLDLWGGSFPSRTRRGNPSRKYSSRSVCR